jgi:hypothetical protein
MGSTTAFQIALAFMVSESIETMKASNHPLFQWISARSEWVSKFTSAFVGVATAIGITIAWNVDSDTGYGALTLAHIPVTQKTIQDVLVIAFEQYWFQKGWYKAFIKGTDNSAEVRSFFKR